MKTETPVNVTLRDLIEKGRKEGELLPEILMRLRGIYLCNPPSTSIYYLGPYDETRGTVRGSFIDEGGDRNRWGPVKLEEIMGYFDMRTVTFRLQRTQDYCPENPAAVADIGS